MKYSHQYSKLDKDEYTTIRRYAKGKVGDIVNETYPNGEHLATITKVERVALNYIPIYILQLDTDLEEREDIYELFQSFYKKPIDFENERFYKYTLEKLLSEERTLKYFAVMCECSIEVRPLIEDNSLIDTRGNCPRCKEPVVIHYFENILTPGYSDYEGEYNYIKQLKEEDDD